MKRDASGAVATRGILRALLGILLRLVDVGSRVHPGQSLAHIIHPYNGQILSDVKATKEGTVFFAHNRPVGLQNALLFMVYTIEM